MAFGFQHCSVAVFAPSPILTVTVENSSDGGEVHFHAGAQGFWVARLAAALGARAPLCVPLGGEAGEVLRSLLDGEGIEVLAVKTSGANAAYGGAARWARRAEAERRGAAGRARGGGGRSD